MPKATIINLFGHLSAPTGLGNAARGYAAGLRAAGIEHRQVDIDVSGDLLPLDLPTINIVNTNPDKFYDARFWSPKGGLNRTLLERACNVGIWTWETPSFIPPYWAPSLPAFDEIWVPSRFVADCLRERLGIEARVVPHAIEVGTPIPDRERFGLPARDFLFFFAFDGHSGFTRKNAIGVIEAFCRAFPEGGAGLVLKVQSVYEADLNRLREAVGARSDVHIRLGPLSGHDRLVLMASCDAHVSLHRAEGFGLSIAEAMALGKPVIATDYSGNTDFMGEGTAFGVSYRLISTTEQLGYYPAGTVWAQPDIEHAAALMRIVWEQPDQARAKGAAAAAYVAEHLSPSTVGSCMRVRIEDLSARRFAGR